LDLGFQHIINDTVAEEDKWWEGASKGDGSICFFDQTRLEETKSMALVAMVIPLSISLFDFLKLK
jgi:hypothetical protein